MFENKKSGVLIFLIIASLMMVACGSKDEALREGQILDELEGEEAGLDIKKEYEELMNKEEKTVGEIKDFLDENLESLSKAEADNMIATFEEYILENLDKSYKVLKSLEAKDFIMDLIGEERILSEDKILKIEDDQIRTTLMEMDSEGYRVSKEGDYLYLTVDYDKIAQYDDYLSSNFKSYLAIKTKELNQPSLGEAGLNISYGELASRLLEIEEHLTSNKEPYGYESLLKKYRTNLLFYLRGREEAPIYDPDTGRLVKDLQDSYKKLAKNKEGITSHIVRKHLDFLEERGFIYGEEFIGQAMSLVNEALNTIERKNQEIIYDKI